ncbi:hypothetical protein H7198_03145 [Fructobacillus sp. CRL 2054]|uniref:hypothetical protein n=1 Tax=Fructobacillus sp. CRL 2054 TaxID=2763007 RepID=UPI0023795138|nr:hypothetical protein [Fructobacillus sp. CRL 2054]MDD9138598.1 hypothetical protein [Fructobacillus sp. CRL 2054]
MFLLGIIAILIILLWLVWEFFTWFLPWLLVIYVILFILSLFGDFLAILFSPAGLVILAIAIFVGIPLGYYVQQKQNNSK